MKQSRLAKIKRRNVPENNPEKKTLANGGPPAPSAGGSAGSTS
jgi:hypothetical protein